MTKIDERFIVNLQGKEFVTYNGLVDLAHQIGIKSIETDIVQFPSEENKFECIVKATVTTEDERVFEDIGDASPTSVSSMLRPHTIRMASTRAKARALRDLTNVGMTALEELGGDEEVEGSTEQKTPGGLTRPQIKRLFTISKANNVSNVKLQELMLDMFDKDSTGKLNVKEYNLLIEDIERSKEQNKPNHEAIEHEVKRHQNPNS